MSQLAQVLSAYTVPLQVWLSPEARKQTATPLMDEFSGRAEVYTQPLSVLNDLKGPAVLIITASEVMAANNEELKALAKIAHPGRAVLLGGTSDRDTLMQAINEWGVIRVLPLEPDTPSLVAAVQDAETYLKREVALVTAIDDLDIETTMQESAIDHLEGGLERTKEKSRISATTTFASGLSTLLRRERAVLFEASKDAEGAAALGLSRPIRGLDILAGLLDKTFDRAVEISADLPPIPESLDELITAVRELISQQGGQDVGGHLGSGARVHVEPLALVHALIQIADRGTEGPTQAIESYRSGDKAIIEFRFPSTVDPTIISDLIDTRAWSMLAVADATLSRVEADPHILRLSLQADQGTHE